MRRALPILAVTIAVGLAWYLAGGFPEPPPEAGPSAPGETGSPALPLMADVEVAPETALGTGEERQEVDPSASLAPELVVTVRGRAVDGITGEPLGGCAVELLCSSRAEEAAAYAAEHGVEVSWRSPERLKTTGDDGRFSFTFVPPPPCTYELRLVRDTYISVSQRRMELEPGTTVDVGDVGLATAVSLRGRVVDTKGVPREEVSVSLDEAARGSVLGFRALSPPDTGVSQADGTLSFGRIQSGKLSWEPTTPIWAGTWNLRVRKAQLVEPTEIVVEPGKLDVNLEVVVRSEEDIETISGVVVDERGDPLSGASVDFLGDLYGSTARSGDDGTFRIERPPGELDAAKLRVTKPAAYETVLTDEEHRWGEEGLRLVLPRGLAVEVLALDAETGDPIEDYGVHWRLAPIRIDSRIEGRNSQWPDHHEDGLTLVSGVLRGENLLVVEPSSEEHQRSRPVRFEVTDRGAPRQVVRIRRNVTGTVAVESSSGEPLAGVDLELIRPLEGQPVGADTQASPFGSVVLTAGQLPVLLDSQTSDESGSARLTGPGEEPLTLRLTGPGLQPLVVPDFVLEPGGERRITMPVGASVTFVAQPVEVLEDWRPDPSARGTARSSTPGIYLVQQGTELGFPLGARSVPFSEDGEVTISGIPPGTWSYSLTHWIVEGIIGRRGTNTIHLGELGDLREGEVREVTIDLSPLAKTGLDLRVLLNGSPFAGATVQARWIDPDGGEARVPAADVVTDERGAASFRLPAGSYRFESRYTVDETGEEAAVLWPEVVALEVGGDLEHVLALRLTSVEVEVLGSDGEPVEGVQLHGVAPDSERPHVTPRTDADGFTRFIRVPYQVLEVRGYRKELSPLRVRSEYERKHGSVPFLELGTIDPRAAEPGGSVRIVMPPESGY